MFGFRLFRKVGSPRPRKRRAPTRPLLAAEVLEDRCLLAASIVPVDPSGTELIRGETVEFRLLDDGAAAQQAQGGSIITTLIGDQSLVPLEVGLNNPANAVAVNGTLYVTGKGVGETEASLQTFDLATGIAGPIQQFQSLNGPGGRSGVQEADRLSDGRILFSGSSALGANSSVPTYWVDDPTAPVIATSFPNSTGVLTGAATNGTFIGTDGGIGSVGMLGGTLQPLPGGLGEIPIDITADARFIIADSIWMLGPTGYQTIDTSGFDQPAGGLPAGSWEGVMIDPVTGQAVFAGHYTDVTTFGLNTGFWNEDGTLLGTFDGFFQDFEVWEGQLVAGLNSGTDGHLLAISDFSSLSFADITGQAAPLREDGLFVGSAGFLLDGPSGPIVTAYATHPTSAVPEPSSVLLWLVGAVGLWLKTGVRRLLTR